jgi:flagellar biosynthetic protein FliP
MNTRTKTIAALTGGAWLLVALLALAPETAAAADGPALNISFSDGGDHQTIATSMKIMVLLTVLSLAPSLFISLTSFVRIIVVMHFLRQAIGTQTMPPNQIMAGLAMFMTFFIMQPAFTKIYDEAFLPFTKEEISLEDFTAKSMGPLRTFMLKQTREKDLALFVEVSEMAPPEGPDDLPITIVIPAFLISEMRTAFTIGFLIYIPFLVLDMVIASVLMSMGMMMLPPVMISLPFKIMLFVLVDGWYLIVGSMMKSFVN